MRLSTRIALSVTVMVPLLVLAAGLLLLALVNRDLRHQQDARLQERATAVLPDVRTLLNAERNGRPKVEQNQNRKVLGGALDAGVRVVAADGAPVLTGGPQPDGTLPATEGGPVTVRAKGHTWRVLTVKVEGPSPGTLWLSSPTSASDPQINAVRRRMFLVALLAAPVSGLLAYAVADRATVSLRRLSRRAAHLDPSTGAAGFTAAERSRITEVDELASSIADLLARYEEQAGRTTQALDAARSFSSAASHELRTPLMSMRTNLDVLSAHPDLSATERAEVVQDLQDDHARMQELLTALRTLAQGDLVEVSAFGPLDLAELVDSVVTETGRRHPTARVSSELPSELRFFGWDTGLRILLANLLGNAVAHGHLPGEPAVITVRLRADGGSALLTVDDAGPGIPPADRTAIFRRFHRRPDSPGSGLGLTLVAQQTALHRGTVTVAAPPGAAGSRFEVRLPVLVADTTTLRLPVVRDWISRSG
ncbi:sensor histidine kinase [Streptomyces sp. NPDC001717]|uniref:sensor histidine kinase n=1 Tax=Streptomyces sp. NPDC001717 TaxID=3364604 RepID=UPI0036972B97